MTNSSQDADQTPDVADLAERAHPEDKVPSSGAFDDPSLDAGTAGGDPLAGVGTPDEPPVHPDGAEEHLDG
ncbi:MAG: hypothetical protein AVDCRST_MAG47-1388 [uncultured Nocardioidaceae bacterium]|uniref:Uncharacterized protein n=1 Tax=uncultured Nocardioidaceae bacterium TaxID=253824 RepID=A0A6J4MYL5_9ACTN|nr:MAG: hypothetical protein AVDCRST_MAG47-1388 [uncultured Nocardioidaceae bacterium]